MQTKDQQQEKLEELIFFASALEVFVRRPTPELRDQLLGKIASLSSLIDTRLESENN